MIDTKRFSRILKGEPMPDKNDAKYKERYEKEKHYGEVFAEKAGLNWLAKKVQLWANNNRKMFLFLAFGFVIFIFLFNILTVSKAYRNRKAHKTTAVELVDKAMKEQRNQKKR